MAARGATGNVTGIFLRQIELTTKRLQVVKDVFPDLRTATVFWDWISADQFRAAERAAPELGLQLFGSELREQPYDYEKALAQAPPDYRSWLFVMTSPFLFRDRARLAEVALRHGAATVFAIREWALRRGASSQPQAAIAWARRSAYAGEVRASVFEGTARFRLTWTVRTTTIFRISSAGQ